LQLPCAIHLSGPDSGRETQCQDDTNGVSSYHSAAKRQAISYQLSAISFEALAWLASENGQRRIVAVRKETKI
jgi:hypothetical protein